MPGERKSSQDILMEVYMNVAVLMPDDNTRRMFIPPEVLPGLESIGNVTWNKGAYTHEDIVPLLKSCDVCITGWGCPELGEAFLKEADSLKLVAHTGGTVAYLVSDYMYDKGIKVISGNEVFAESVAEGTIAYIFAGLRRIPFCNKEVQSGKWGRSDNSGLLDKKVGLVGFGAVARYLVPMLKAFRVEIAVYDPFVSEETLSSYGVLKENSLETLFAENDIVSLHLAKRPETDHLINGKLLSLMKDGTLFVNTARGMCVDEQALARELMTGRISAVLDVFQTEPLPLDSKFRGLDNVILIPHLAGPTKDRQKFVLPALVEDMRRLMEGKPLKLEISREYAMKMTK